MRRPGERMKHLAAEVPDAKETEASGKGQEQSYAPHSTDEGGELAQPGPTRGKEGTSRRIGERKHGGTPRPRKPCRQNFVE